MFDTIECACGRWREILPQFGVETRFLTNKHGPCPLCGGRDRFRFDDKEGTGSYYCNQCGAGVGLILIRKLKGWDYAKACEEVDKIIGCDASSRTDPKPKREDGAARRRAMAERLLAEARDRRIVDDYLAARGITVSSPVLRGHLACPYFDDNQKYVGRFPAVIAPITGADGELQSVQRIYIAEVERRKKALANVKGGAVWLTEPVDGVLGCAEGIENALSASQLFGGVPVWSLLNAGNLEAFAPPEGLSRLLIFGNCDRSFTGQHAAYGLARRMRHSRPSLDVQVHIPLVEGADWNDVLRAQSPRSPGR